MYALPEVVTLDDKTLIYLAVPESSQVHRCNGKIFDRNEDGVRNLYKYTKMYSGGSDPQLIEEDIFKIITYNF